MAAVTPAKPKNGAYGGQGEVDMMAKPSVALEYFPKNIIFLFLHDFYSLFTALCLMMRRIDLGSGWFSGRHLRSPR